MEESERQQILKELDFDEVAEFQRYKIAFEKRRETMEQKKANTSITKYKGFTIEPFSMRLTYGDKDYGTLVYFIVKNSNGVLYTSDKNFKTLKQAKAAIDKLVNRKEVK